MKTLICLFVAFCALAAAPGFAQESEDYVPETDPLVMQKLANWQDWKFGFLIHWGPYSQWGVVESWSICSEDVPWCARPAGISYVDYKKKYEALPTTFNPRKFAPDAWARAAKDAGMKYVVFTTKHHDGFSMYDTRETDYRITAPNVPFHTDPRANIAKEVFDAFRRQGFGIGAYFSKPDWHHPDYWAPEWATPDRNVNYDTRKHADRWQRFVAFVHRQIGEITSTLGPLDVLWLDGGWVNPQEHPHALPGSGEVPWPQDVDMAGIAALARKNQPGLIVVDRAVGGRYENYRTPEQKIPDKPLPYPWETCMTMGDSWSYKPNDKYKSSRELVHKLVDVVAKGGNFLLNVGPDANGELPKEATVRMREIGAWMQVNSAAIYASQPAAPYVDGHWRFTRLRDGTAYAIYLADADDRNLPQRLTLTAPALKDGAELELLGYPGALHWQRGADGAATVDIPDTARQALAGAYAWTIRIASTR